MWELEGRGEETEHAGTHERGGGKNLKMLHCWL